MQEERIIIYPVDDKIIPFIKYCDLVENMDIVGCFAPSNLFYCGKKILLDNNILMEIRDIKDCLEFEFDSILIVESNDNLDFTTSILPILKLMGDKRKKIYVTRTLSDKERTVVKEECIDYNMIVDSNYMEEIDIDISKRILKIKTPIVFVLGMYEHTEKLESLLHVHNYLKEAGYNVKSVLTKNNEIKLSGCYSFPKMMIDEHYSDKDKIIYFNHFIRKIEIKENPDIIIIGIPGELIPLNDQHNGNFGVMPFLISNAVSCDYAILNMFYNFSEREFVDQIKDVCKCKYSIEINAIVVSKNVLDITSTSTAELKFYNMSQQEMKIESEYFYENKNSNGISLGADVIGALGKYGSYNNI